jgi:hypothetical protein
MKYAHILIVVALVSLVGCATAPRMNRLSVGMTKQDVCSTLGDPDSSASPGGGVEVLRYELTTKERPYGLISREYFVRLVNGKVESYGKMGDFDSTKDPTLNFNIKNR